MTLINPKNNPLSFKEDFVKNGSVFIRDFLDQHFAEKIADFFEHGMPRDWWYSSSYSNDHPSINYIRNFDFNTEAIKTESNLIHRRMNEGQFTYWFYRTTGDHVEGCNCEECEFRKWLLSEELLGFLSQVSGLEITKFDTTFASKYSEGCFLSPHHDHKNGDIGFVLQLTRNWKPQWGGLLHFMSDDQKSIEETEVPTFNTLTLFHLPEGSGKWHFVSHVNPGVTRSRIAYTGWFSR